MVDGVDTAAPEPGQALQCANPDCDFAQTGVCVDGLVPAECPHTNPVEVGAGDDDPTEPPAPKIVRLFGSTPLTPREADALAADRGATVVLLAGEAEAGKTTLLVSLFELFRQGPVGDIAFAGSQTLLVFEERAWPARAASGADRPDTLRTAPGVGFLHLLVEHAGQLRDLLLTDIWGESFENIVDGAPAGDELPIATRADVVIVMVDGERIVDTGRRQETLRRARQLVGGLSEQAVLRPQARLIVALNKLDALSEDDAAWWQARHDQVAEPARRRLSDVRSVEIAARPDPAPHTPRNLGALLLAVLQPLVVEQRSLTAPPDDVDPRAFWEQA